MRQVGRYHDDRRHPCGCRTVFDTAEWRSIFLSVCDEHSAPRFAASVAKAIPSPTLEQRVARLERDGAK
jgi:hypothetical protein